MKLGLYIMFERDVTDILGPRIQSSDQYAKEFWSALANQGWVHNAAPEQEVSYSFRAAGDLIARIRGTGHYMDWYMCGPDGVVAPWISEAMAKLGWQSEKYDSPHTPLEAAVARLIQKDDKEVAR